MWGIIGGSGFEHFDEFETLESLSGETPFGDCSSGLSRVRLAGEEVIFLPRHGERHELLPSEINYRANVYRLRSLGVTKVMSISAVGSLRKKLKPGDLVIPTQCIDRTKSIRPHTFCGDGVVAHVSLAKPVNQELVNAIFAMREQLGFDVHVKQTHVCIEGPYFSTQAESLAFREWGADIVGMTSFPEYGLVREAGMGYVICAFVTDYDCWDPDIPHVTIDVVLDLMKQNNHKAFKLATRLVAATRNVLPGGCSELGIKGGMMVPWSSVPEKHHKWLSVLIGQPVRELCQ